MSLIFVDDKGQETQFTKSEFEKIMTDPLYNGAFKFSRDDKDCYLLIDSNKGSLQVRAKGEILSKDDLYFEFEKLGIKLPFSIEFEHIYS